MDVFRTESFLLSGRVGTADLSAGALCLAVSPLGPPGAGAARSHV